MELSKKVAYAFIGSAVLNVSLLTFVLGRMSLTVAPALPPAAFPAAVAPAAPAAGPAAASAPASAPKRSLPVLTDLRPSPQVMFLPVARLRNREELKSELAKAAQAAAAMKDMRAELAGKLRLGAVTKEEVLTYYLQVNQMMDDRREAVQRMTAEYIAALSEKERVAYAARLLRMGGAGAAPAADAATPPLPKP